MKKVVSRLVLLMVIISMHPTHAVAQNILSRNVTSFEMNRQCLGDALEILSNKGDFYFSYNSSIIKRHSLVSVKAYNKTVRQILEYLFKANYEFKESGNYIILRRAPVRITIITNKAITEDKFYAVSGYVVDDASGIVISDASIYEKQRLVSTLTNQQGFFKIRLKSKFKTAALTVSKEFNGKATGTGMEITLYPIPASMS